MSFRESQLGCLRKKKKLRSSSPEPKAVVSEVSLKAAPEEKLASELVVETSPAQKVDPVNSGEDLAECGPTLLEEKMAAYLGASGIAEITNGESSKDDDSLPTLEEAIAKVPAKARALMDELFRAKLEKVKRIDPKDIC